MDVNLTLFDNATHTADTLSSKIDFGVTGGCPESALFINVGATNGTTDFEIHTSDDDSTYTPLALKIAGVNAAGQYVVLLNNAIVKTRYMKLNDNLGTATSVTVTAYLLPDY